MSGGISAAISLMVTARVGHLRSRPPGVSSALPTGNSTSLWNTNRSPTIPDARPVGQHVAQLAEEFAAVALQLLDLGRQRHVQLLAEIGDLRCPFPCPCVSQIERLGNAAISCAFSSSTC